MKAESLLSSYHHDTAVSESKTPQTMATGSGQTNNQNTSIASTGSNSNIMTSSQAHLPQGNLASHSITQQQSRGNCNTGQMLLELRLLGLFASLFMLSDAIDIFKSYPNNVFKSQNYFQADIQRNRWVDQTETATAFYLTVLSMILPLSFKPCNIKNNERPPLSEFLHLFTRVGIILGASLATKPIAEQGLKPVWEYKLKVIEWFLPNQKEIFLKYTGIGLGAIALAWCLFNGGSYVGDKYRKPKSTVA